MANAKGIVEMNGKLREKTQACKNITFDLLITI